MKKKIFCLGILIFWTLIVCTLFSAKIQEQMPVQVRIAPTSKALHGVKIPADSLYWDADGSYHLYTPVEGDGWESGIRVAEVDSSVYQLAGKMVEIIQSSASEQYIQYSTKPFRVGDLVVLQGAKTKADDYYLAIYDDAVPQLKISGGSISIEAQTQSLLLVSVKDADQPFMEKQAQSSLQSIEAAANSSDPLGAEKTVYSLLAVAQFMENIPRLTALLLLLLIPGILWVYSCFLCRDARKNRNPLLANSGICAVLLLCMPWILKTIDLPASMLPQSRITEVPYYIQEFSQIFGFLRELSGSSAVAREAVSGANRALLTSLGILLAGLLLAAAVIAAENAMIRKAAKNAS